MRLQIHDEHPAHTRADWRAEVGAENTQLGYWDWVSHRVEEVDGAQVLSQILPLEVIQNKQPEAK